ncbi:DUF4349 domain-containing protein [Argonema galeatum]|uniref:DUF4349 domain-containing protein n=1 Tax=Argonema galeatum TaxID=2942762 RepID=UPI002011F282|nr:DUF4349 domain-containing protein [Argonema galeatum]MCL1463806.1 DUF4349 domain-containing protein [Argonema galeatum A003/A1]
MKNELKTNNPKSDRLLNMLLIGTFSAIALPSCSQSYNATRGSSLPQISAKSAAMPAAEPAPMAAMDNMADSPAPNVVASADGTIVASAPAKRSLPQLIKKAELTLVVGSIDKSMREVSTIIRKQQGDLLGFQDSQPIDSSSRHTASMQIRVPSPKLDTTLDTFAKLGTVQSRSLTAEDVSDQLVDYQARLKNLRKSEEAVLKILERSGSIRDVLQVSKELSNIRESIERISAQLNNLQNQVAYSTITLNLEAAVSATPASGTPVGLRVQETWGQATHSVSELTFNLLSLSIWLFAFIPYLLLISAAGYGFYRFRKNKTNVAAQKPNLPPSS